MGMKFSVEDLKGVIAVTPTPALPKAPRTTAPATPSTWRSPIG